MCMVSGRRDQAVTLTVRLPRLLTPYQGGGSVCSRINWQELLTFPFHQPPFAYGPWLFSVLFLEALRCVLVFLSPSDKSSWMNSFLPQKDGPGFTFSCLNAGLLKPEEFDSYAQEFNSNSSTRNQKASAIAFGWNPYKGEWNTGLWFCYCWSSCLPSVHGIPL